MLLVDFFERFRLMFKFTEISHFAQTSFARKFKGGGKTQLRDRDGWRLTWGGRGDVPGGSAVQVLSRRFLFGRRTAAATHRLERNQDKASCWQHVLGICWSFFSHDCYMTILETC